MELFSFLSLRKSLVGGKAVVYLWLQYLKVVIIFLLLPVRLPSQNQKISEPTLLLHISDLNLERERNLSVATRFVSGKAGPEPDFSTVAVPAIEPCSTSFWAEFSM